MKKQIYEAPYVEFEKEPLNEILNEIICASNTNEDFVEDSEYTW